MRSKITLLIIFVFSLFTINSHSQGINTDVQGGEYKFNESKTPCLTEVQRADIKTLLQNNTNQLKTEGRLIKTNTRGSHILFEWPLQQSSSSGTTYNDTWAISGYVDHNLSYPNALTDYNCGTTTYDTEAGYNHQGVDVYLWPFSWKQMDDNQTEIIAAADGQIIAINDGEYDRSCNFNNNVWNAVYVQHSDGSVAWYGHMKNGSVIEKTIGQMVTQGEVLGIVGSSGNSTGPHLHFEVYQDNSYTQLIDPYYGACNELNGDSWWVNQKPYKNPKINAVLTHSQAPDIFPSCPTTETPYISNDFETDDTFFFATYLRDQTAGEIISFEIIRPDNSSLFGNWNATVTTTASSWYYYYGGYTGYFDMVGEWKWSVTFAGETITNTFNVTNPLGIEENDFNAIKIYPNPFNNVVNISSNSNIRKATVVNILGKTIKTLESSSESISEISLEALSNGVYFLSLEGNSGQKKTIKIIKK